MLKVFYLAAVTAGIFAVPLLGVTRPIQFYLVAALLGAQVLALLACKISFLEIFLPAWRLKWLFLFLMIAYAFLPPESSTPFAADFFSFQIPGLHWTASVNLTGIAQAARMCLQIITVLLATSVVRLTGESSDLSDGLQRLRLPPLFVHSLDRTLDLLAGKQRRPGRGGGGGGGGGGRGAEVGMVALVDIQTVSLKAACSNIYDLS